MHGLVRNVLAFGVVLWLAVTGTAFAGSAPTLPPANVYLRTQKGFPDALAQKLATEIGERLHLKILVVPGYELPLGSYNPLRKQYETGAILSQARDIYAEQLERANATMIVLLDKDLYIASMNWRYCFGTYTVPGRVSVLSTARLDMAFYGLPADEKLLHDRIEKFVTRYIGMQYFGLPTSGDRNSVLYESIMSLDDLDMIGNRF